MSKKDATTALNRMNTRPVLIAGQYAGLSLDFQTLAQADNSLEEAYFQEKTLGAIAAAYGFSSRATDKPFAFSNGLAIIPIHGTLLNRFGGSYGYVTGYSAIRSQMNAALADDDVKGIVFDVNSYGGEAAGCFELAADIFAARDKKPSMSVVDSNAYSAGYALASAAGKMVVTPSGGVGSIGVVAMHVSLEKALDSMGVQITFIYAGDHKVDGNPYQNLSAEAKANIQAGIDKAYEKFVSLVSTNRGMDAQKVKDTQAQTYDAEDALSMGLIDAVQTPQEAVSAFFNELSGSTTLKGKTMDKENEAGAGKALTAEDLKAAATAAAAAERQRMAGITGCDEAKGKAKLASHLAMNTGMSVDEAKLVLAAAAPEVTSEGAGDNALQTAMGKEGGAGVIADRDHGGKKELTGAAKILAAQGKAHGKTVEAK